MLLLLAYPNMESINLCLIVLRMFLVLKQRYLDKIIHLITYKHVMIGMLYIKVI